MRILNCANHRVTYAGRSRRCRVTVEDEVEDVELFVEVQKLKT